MKRLSLISNHLKEPREVCIVAYGRSPILPSNKDFADISNSELASQVISGILSKYSISPSNIEEFYLGKVFSSSIGQSPAKQILSRVENTDHISCMSLNKLCASSMKALTLGALSILSNNSECVLVGGLEIMSQSPYVLNLRNGIQTKVKDSFNLDGFPDAVTKEFPMQIADAFSIDKGYTKRNLDEYAKISCERAKTAEKAGKFKNEIISIKKKGKIIEKDTLKGPESIENTKPVYKNGVNTAGNSCGINDGASFMVLCSKEKALKHNWKVLAKVLSFADAEQHASLFPSTPSLAIEKSLKNVGLAVKNVDFMEINEPFAAVVLENSKILGFPVEKINCYGGVISLGHPVGSSGCRIVGTLINVLENEGGKIGVAAICNAGGGGTAVVIKKE